ncbi:TPA: hypothetical protein ACTUT5_003557 [Legionella anisa]|uniref:hypothetical protein n=1 Tax=Legionella anisa TaxID=28082 RepID=UPI00197D938A|nr:hypothetical protein [Legionella anisa]MBN5937443.1 hypothetical protein [Legionella anisa]
MKLHEIYGIPETAKLIHSICDSIKQIGSNENLIFQSRINLLSIVEKENLVKNFEERNIISKLQTALHDFIYLYPESQFSFIFKKMPSKLNNKNFLTEYKSLLSQLINRVSEQAIFMQALPIYSAVLLGTLKIAKGLTLADIEPLKDYPNTTQSQEIGASIRSALTMMIVNQVIEPKLTDWIKYFWNRGIEIEPLDLAIMEIDYE